jgi:hypothetical protein
MKAVNYRAVLLIWWIVALLTTTTISTYGAEQPVQIKLETSRESIRSGKGLGILVTLKNTSHQSMILSEFGEDYHDAAPAEYVIKVQTDDGNSAPLTEKGERIYERSEILVAGIYRSTLLQPGDSVSPDISH